jgi:predicted adenine nucleotide alpha hydrolase (AANH) superfamily ATPase
MERDRSLSILLWFYNPNIHPISEFRRRRDALSFLVHSQEKFLFHDANPIVVDFSAPYDLSIFFDEANKAKDMKERCETCYTIRLKAAAKEAKKRGYEYFSSTLLFSKQQRHDVIRFQGEEAARENGISFYYEDFRVGHKEGRDLSYSLDIYRQRYCGCVFSEAGI